MRQVFYSFYYKEDSWRAAQVRNMGVVDGNKPANDNDWEEIEKGGKDKIKEWIKEQMKGRTCTIVLVGENTAGREFVEYEIKESWKDGMGLAGVCIHGLKDIYGKTSRMGKNPFDNFLLRDKKMSEVVKCYDPGGANSREKYNWIEKYLKAIIEEAIQIRKDN